MKGWLKQNSWVVPFAAVSLAVGPSIVWLWFRMMDVALAGHDTTGTLGAFYQGMLYRPARFLLALPFGVAFTAAVAVAIVPKKRSK